MFALLIFTVITGFARDIMKDTEKTGSRLEKAGKGAGVETAMISEGRMANFLWRWGPVAIMVVAIFLFSSIPSRQMPRFGHYDLLVKKGGHALGYGLLAAAFWRGFDWGKKLWWLAFLLTILYSVTDEFHQSFVPGRHPSPVDLAIDSAGSAIMLFICALTRRRRTR